MNSNYSRRGFVKLTGAAAVGTVVSGAAAKTKKPMEVLLIQEEEIRCDDGRGSWRRKGWSIADRRFLEVVRRHMFNKPADFLTLIPGKLADPFSTQDLAENTNQPRWLAQKMAYCLRKMGAIEGVGKTGNSILYSTANNPASKLP